MKLLGKNIEFNNLVLIRYIQESGGQDMSLLESVKVDQLINFIAHISKGQLTIKQLEDACNDDINFFAEMVTQFTKSISNEKKPKPQVKAAAGSVKIAKIKR